jgi:dipeptide transport system substrate-binding protein
MVMKAKTLTNTKARTSEYIRSQEFFNKQLPWVTLAHATVYRAVSRNVTGYKISPLGIEDFYPIDLN